MGESIEAARVRLLYDLGCAFAAKTELGELIPFVVKRCREALNAEAASVLLLNPEGSELYFPYVSDDNPDVARRMAGLRQPSDRGICGAALREGRAIVVEDAQHDARFYPGIDRETGLTTRSIVAVPLSSGRGAIGVLEVLNRRDGGSFNAGDLTFLEAISGSVAISIENARLYEQLRDSEASLRTQVSALRRDLARDSPFADMVGSGPAMEEVFHLMETASSSMITVLIEGETGTGKELVARGIHRVGNRSDGTFLAVNCAAVPETLLESELFGYRRGSFSGAVRDSPGIFRAAAKGVVFLDEVGEMPARMQAKLLRVLEQEEIIPIGDSFPVKVDVRVISATNKNLEEEVRLGNFREDLYYRLSAFPIRLPPLRDRREDIPLLASLFIALAAKRHNKRISGIETAALDLMNQFDWPGNLRQLRNEIERAVALSRDGDPLKAEYLLPLIKAAAGRPSLRSAKAAVPAPEPLAAGMPSTDPPAPPPIPSPSRPLREVRAEFEATYIKQALLEQRGNVSRTAQVLGLSRPALQEKMKTYGLR